MLLAGALVGRCPGMPARSGRFGAGVGGGGSVVRGGTGRRGGERSRDGRIEPGRRVGSEYGGGLYFIFPQEGKWQKAVVLLQGCIFNKI